MAFACTCRYCNLLQFLHFLFPRVLIDTSNVVWLGVKPAIHKHTAPFNLLAAVGSNDNNVHLRYSVALDKTQILLKD